MIRINELARDLEVKPKLIIDLLPDYGVTEKKTHSSSIETDIAEKIRERIEIVKASSQGRSGFDTDHDESSQDDSDHDESPQETNESSNPVAAQPSPAAFPRRLSEANPKPESSISTVTLDPEVKPPENPSDSTTPAAEASSSPAAPPAPAPKPAVGQPLRAPLTPPLALGRSSASPLRPPINPTSAPTIPHAAPPPLAAPVKASMPVRPTLVPKPAAAAPAAVGVAPTAEAPKPSPSSTLSGGTAAGLAQAAPQMPAPRMPAPPVAPAPAVPAVPAPAAPSTAAPVSEATTPAVTTPPPAPALNAAPAPPTPAAPLAASPSISAASTPAAPAAPRPATPPAAMIAPGSPAPSSSSASQPQAPQRPTQPNPAAGGLARTSVPPGTPIGSRAGQVLAPGRPAVPPPPSARTSAPGMPMPRPQANQPLAGPRAAAPSPSRPPLGASAPGYSGPGAPKAPATRPVVPPDPKLAERIAQSQARQQQGPGAPAARPGAPLRPPGPAMPGRPQQPQSARPGFPQGRGPGGPMPGAPSGPGGPGRPRTGKHPTSPGPLRPESAIVPTSEPSRRHATKPSKSKEQIKREKELEEEGKLLRAIRKREEESVLAVNKEITFSEGITVKELSEKLGIKTNTVIKKLLEKKIFATINQPLDVKLAEEVAAEFGATATQMTFEEESIWDIEMAEESGELVRRAPVVTVMGHVDHGKTSLLDAIRSANVAAGEAGGITQHIGAYAVAHNDRKLVFIDTPGHEAFTRMRARGAKVTDIVVLCVAADDGVMPQTLEAIDHARAAQVPLIVAINKIDKPEAQIDRIKQQLSDRGLLAEDWGGDTVMVPVSAKQRINIDLLLENLLLVADVNEEKMKANPTRPAVATVLEAQLDRGRGPVATVLVRNGTLRVQDYFICGSVFGKVRAMFDDRGTPIREAEPSTPVEVLGLEELPEVGDTFQVVTDTAKAKQIVLYREGKAREQAMARTKINLEQLHEQLKEGVVKDLNLILKADVGGSAEVLAETLQKLSNDKVRVVVLRTGVGAITETDVLLASASNAIIIGFNVRPERSASATAESEKVDIRLHTIIYEVVDEMKKAMAGLLDPVYKEVIKGHVEVREVFVISKVGTVAGCYVTDGLVTRDSSVRILRDNIVVHTTRVDALKRFKNDASEVKAGFECGISLVNYQDIKPGDIFEVFVKERVALDELIDA